MRFSSILVLSSLSAFASAAAVPQRFGGGAPGGRPGFPGSSLPGRPPFPGRPTPPSGGATTSAVAVPSSAAPSDSTPTDAVPTDPATTAATDIATTPTTVADPVSTPAACDVSGIEQPVAPTPLPVPSDGLVLALVAMGSGTQNYTCGTNATAAPTSIGAVATLTDGNCAISGSSDAATDAAAAIGRHFFFDSTTPEFDVTTLGNTQLKRAAGSNAPTNSNGDVPWLKLAAQTSGTTGSVKEIYRLRTSGGSAPATCEGMPEGTFTVPYTAQYWFYVSA